MSLGIVLKEANCLPCNITIGISTSGSGQMQPLGIIMRSTRSAVAECWRTLPCRRCGPRAWVSWPCCALPGVAIFITSPSFNLVSDGLRQAMDVRT